MTRSTPVKIAIAFCLAMTLAAPAAASSPWKSSVHLPPGGSITTPPLTLWPVSWALDWWYAPLPGAETTITTPAATITCAQLACTARVHTYGPDIVVSVAGVYPYSGQGYRLTASTAHGVTTARLYAGGALVASESARSNPFAAAGPIVITEPAGDALIGPLRLWATADAPLALYRHPAPPEPGLVGLWDPVSDGALLDLMGGLHGVLAGGAEANSPICWRDPTELVFWDNFETGNALRWIEVVGDPDPELDPPDPL